MPFAKDPADHGAKEREEREDSESEEEAFGNGNHLEHEPRCRTRTQTQTQRTRLPSTTTCTFDENYALAATQSLKNKDIPEGGAKGTILPSLGANPRTAFEKYVDVRGPPLPAGFR